MKPFCSLNSTLVALFLRCHDILVAVEPTLIWEATPGCVPVWGLGFYHQFSIRRKGLQGPYPTFLILHENVKYQWGRYLQGTQQQFFAVDSLNDQTKARGTGFKLLWEGQDQKIFFCSWGAQRCRLFLIKHYEAAPHWSAVDSEFRYFWKSMQTQKNTWWMVVRIRAAGISLYSSVFEVVQIVGRTPFVVSFLGQNHFDQC